MIGFLRAIGERGENAVRQGLWAFAGAGLIVLALGFAAGALVEALTLLMPRYAALGCGALALLIAAAICFAKISRHQKALPVAPAAPPLASTFASMGGGADWKAALSLALVEEAREKPARAAALAALAGLILGALEGLEDLQAKKPS